MGPQTNHHFSFIFALSSEQTMTQPQPSEYTGYNPNYVALASEGDSPIDFLKQQAVWQLLHTLSEEQSQHRYAEGKWSIKELLGHMIDTERIFAYRALCLARGEQQNLPGFDENPYVENAHFEKRTFASLLAEYQVVRHATLVLFENFDENVWANLGTNNNKPASVRALVYLTAGHEKHHINILKERYLH